MGALEGFSSSVALSSVSDNSGAFAEVDHEFADVGEIGPAKFGDDFLSLDLPIMDSVFTGISCFSCSSEAGNAKEVDSELVEMFPFSSVTDTPMSDSNATIAEVDPGSGDIGEVDLLNLEDILLSLQVLFPSLSLEQLRFWHSTPG